MNWFQALILGIVEGITEYLPVSSTGHLLLTQRLLGIRAGDASNAFAICIQAGAIVAVLGLYRNRLSEITRGLLGHYPEGFRLGVNIVAAFIPTMVIGLLLEKPVKHYFFGGSALGFWPITAAWLVGGVAILAVQHYRRVRVAQDRPRFDLSQLTWRMAVIIGLCQCVAMWPGTSRSLVSIVAGVLVGLRLASAVEFSFLIGVVTLGAATAHDALKFGPAMLHDYGPASLAIGFIAAWLAAVLAVKWMVNYLSRHGLGLFGYYRILLALAVAALILSGRLTVGG
jgi:undecaprenyl-diphosphatase